ncbi:MAG: hypothetical protein AAF203_02100, partial [Pseudomonadota bacterium]
MLSASEKKQVRDDIYFLKILELKKILYTLELPQVGKKQILIDRILHFYGISQNRQIDGRPQGRKLSKRQGM